MSGLRKAKKYDWQDSNLALFGSDTEKQVKKESAESEPAWQGSGQDVGLRIWRINKFKVEDWPKEDYGKFYSGDSYILLNTYKEKDTDELLYDLHFWIGKYSTQDEYGTAAYKTVELDTFHDDKPIQHREVQGHESQMFKSYFPSMTIMEGGADTGFRKVEKDKFVPRLMKFQKENRKVIVNEVARKKASMSSSDVFILDTGELLYMWKGKDCNKDESFKAAQYLTELISSRSGRSKKEILDEDDCRETDQFYSFLDCDDCEDDDEDDEDDSDGVSKLLKVSDADGSLDCEEVKDGDISLEDLDSNDVMIIDKGKSLYVWVGSQASPDEKKNAIPYAHNYLQSTQHKWAAITVIPEGSRSIPEVA